MQWLTLLIMILFTLVHGNDHITLQLHWKHQFQFAGYYVAKEKGFYTDAGLDVTIREYHNGMNVIDEVLNQKAQFGIGQSNILIHRSKGDPVVALAANFQRSPMVLITTNPDIRTVHDLRDKRIMMTPDAANAVPIISMLMAHGISMENIVRVPHSFDIQDLIEQRVDAMACYLSNEPFRLTEAQVPFQIFNPETYDFDFYGDILFTSDKQILHHPERVKKFYEASKRGWAWAFEHIEETAELIHTHYNLQNKSLKSLVFEGNILKGLAHNSAYGMGHIDPVRLSHMEEVYRLNGLISGKIDYRDFNNPIGLGKTPVYIGVLAKRGAIKTMQRWSQFIDLLNARLQHLHFTLVPLDFEALDAAVKAESIDFVITNTMYYVQMEYDYHISRIATLLNYSPDKPSGLSQFGGVIFTRADNQALNTIDDLEDLHFGAVSERSFGGWAMAYKELKDHGIDRDDLEVEFLDTHDAVVYAVLSGEVDAGTVRTDTLERMAKEQLIQLDKIKVIQPQNYQNFPFLISTPLYPEWPIAKLHHVDDKTALEIVSVLISIDADSTTAVKTGVAGWTVPLDYTIVHKLLRELRLPPYEKVNITVSDILERYTIWVVATAILLLFLLAGIIYNLRMNRFLKKYTHLLDQQVKARTHELSEANERLKELVHIDPLTQLYNHGYFMDMGRHYFGIAKRNGTPLQVMMLDIDFFKNINDTYGHQAGDKVLFEFARTLSRFIRESDLLGRIGGEEFAICLQNTTMDGAHELAHRIRQTVEALRITVNDSDEVITFTVSIGIAGHNSEKDFEKLLKASDEALYQAKNSGRNRVEVYRHP